MKACAQAAAKNLDVIVGRKFEGGPLKQSLYDTDFELTWWKLPVPVPLPDKNCLLLLSQAV